MKPFFDFFYGACRHGVHIALATLVSATIHAADRPWWEGEIEQEMARVEEQNIEIRESIADELKYHNDAVFAEFEKVSETYLEQTERRWTDSDESIIRAEVRRLNAAMRPYFNVPRTLFDVDGYMKDPTKR